MGKFFIGLLLGGLICTFCAICYLPLNITNDVRSWVKQPELATVQVDNNQDDETQIEESNIFRDSPNNKKGAKAQGSASENS